MSRGPLFLLFVTALLAPALHASKAHAARVLFVADATSDTEITSVLGADGHTVDSVTNDFATGNATLRSADLSGYGLVVWSANGSGYGDQHNDPAVFAHLTHYVRQGGRVLVTGYDSVASPSDPLLIEFLGGTGSTDVPSAPGPVSMEATSLSTGARDLRGVVPIPASPDRDTLTGLMPDTIAIVATADGSAGAQWTLRRVGRGEIAYVSNGDSAGSSASWSNASADGAGAYNAALRNFALAANGADSTSSAQASTSSGSPRRAHTLSLTEAPSAAVLVGASRAWIPSGVAVPLSVCGASCHPVVETRACEAPECPGTGTLLITGERIADVGDFPRDRDGWNAERMRLAADPELASIAWALGTHPDPPPPPPRPLRFLRSPHPTLGWELHVEGAIGAIVENGTPIGTVSASVGPRFMPHDIDEPLDVMYGNIHGLDAHATLAYGLDGQHPDDYLVLVGLAPAFGYALPDERVRLPSAFAFLAPELGAALSSSRAPTYYFAWHLEGALLVDEHVGVDVRGDLVILADWNAPDTFATMLTLGVGALFR